MIQVLPRPFWEGPKLSVKPQGLHIDIGLLSEYHPRLIKTNVERTLEPWRHFRVANRTVALVICLVRVLFHERNFDHNSKRLESSMAQLFCCLCCWRVLRISSHLGISLNEVSHSELGEAAMTIAKRFC